MRKILAIALAVVMLVLTACSSAPQLNGTLSELTAKITSEYDFSSVSFTYKSDEYSDEVLMYMYGIEDEALVNAIDDFVLSERTGLTAATFAMIRFKDGTDDEVYESVRNKLVSAYVEPLVSALAPYNPEQTAIAEKYTIKTYKNTLVLVIYADDNNSVFKSLEG